MLRMEMSMCWPASAPTCKPLMNLPSRRFISLKVVVLCTRSTSLISCLISDWMEERSVVVRVPFSPLTASSFILCNISSTSFRAPSAVCTTLIPSCAFAAAWVRPLTCLRIFSEMERPAPSFTTIFFLRYFSSSSGTAL